jgi:Zn-dependent M28 family amino/carboxypeptidase
MRTIYKYPLDFTEAAKNKDNRWIIPIKGLIRVLSITKQQEKPMLYALVDTEKTNETKVEVTVCGTGNPHLITKDMTFAATLGFQDDEFMFHFFYKRIKK